MIFFSWTYILNQLAGYNALSLRHSKEPMVTLARGNFARPSVEELLNATKNSLTFIVGRNPFERLVSGFRDKIRKGPSTRGEEFVDEVSTYSRRSLSEGFFFAGEVFLRRDIVDE